MIRICYSMVFFRLSDCFGDNKKTRIKEKCTHQYDDYVQDSRNKIRMMVTCLREIQTPVKDLLGLDHIVSEIDPGSSLYLYAVSMNACGNLLAEMIENMRLYYMLSCNLHELCTTEFLLRSSLKDKWDSILKKANTNIGGMMHTVTHIGKISCELKILKSVPGGVVQGDSLCVKKIFGALIDNAIRFTHQGFVKATIGCTRKGKSNLMIIITVSDTGIGVPEDSRDAIFEPLVRAHTDSVHGGAGMGLSVARLLCRSTGGDLILENATPSDEFSTSFRASFCLTGNMCWTETEWETKDIVGGVKDVPQCLDEWSGNEALDIKPIMPSVLVAEDVKLNRDIARHIFEQVGVKIVTAIDGLDAVEHCQKTKFDIIFMDVFMPNMDGISASKTIKSDCPLNKETPIVALTGSSSSTVVEECLTAGMSGYIIKPVGQGVLIPAISRHIRLEHKLWMSKMSAPSK